MSATIPHNRTEARRIFKVLSDHQDFDGCLEDVVR